MTKLRSKQVKKLLSHNEDFSVSSRIIISVLILSIVGPLSYHLTNISMDYLFWKEPEIINTLYQFGYSGIVPPSTLNGPGTFNTVEHQSDGTVRLHPTCEID